ncbi:YwgA family protein [Fictibacillus sp. 5RED26]|uniref:YwgA family protein n=1 Tax=Fictibacillus TaxID=1329200 RepID=UPI0018CE59E2|nr:YwgA family protein [Fictibacillus sp. 5RED26]MBH0164478.1 YwgA family protein [Fictibacillus sp. 7GRE50]MBH0175322.1 YwgA family protein [Fictibacillus sp. 23RED33]
MFEDHLKVVTLIQEAGEVVGRKKLQKMVYIAKKLNFPYQEKYQFHFYGPYSEELTLKIEELCNMGYIHEVKEKVSGYSQYRYAVNEEGKKLLSTYGAQIEKLGSCVRSMNEQSSRFLELVSTVMYFEKLEKDEIKEKVQTVKAKQKYTEEEMDEAFLYIDSLKGQVQ